MHKTTKKLRAQKAVRVTQNNTNRGPKERIDLKQKSRYNC